MKINGAITVNIVSPGEKDYQKGLQFEIGRGEMLDKASAFEYYLKAANAGYAKAQYKLAINYEARNGYKRTSGFFFDKTEERKGVDHENAYYWILLACACCPQTEDSDSDFETYSSLRDEISAKLTRSVAESIEGKAVIRKASLGVS